MQFAEIWSPSCSNAAFLDTPNKVKNEPSHWKSQNTKKIGDLDHKCKIEIPMEAQEGKILRKCWINFTDANPWQKTQVSFSARCNPAKKQAMKDKRKVHSLTYFNLAPLKWKNIVGILSCQ